MSVTRGRRGEGSPMNSRPLVTRPAQAGPAFAFFGISKSAIDQPRNTIDHSTRTVYRLVATATILGESRKSAWQVRASVPPYQGHDCAFWSASSDTYPRSTFGC
jgi:hypothetical protein